MKKAKKVLALLLCAVLLIGASVTGTLAYLTDSQDVTNTFTVGNVYIKLDEANVNNETGKAITGRTEDGNKNVLMVPGRVIDKDPTITVLKNSENCYVRAVVTVTVPSWNDDAARTARVITGEETFETWATKFAAGYLLSGQTAGFNTNAWNVPAPVVEPDAHTITYTITYKNTASDNIVLKDTEGGKQLPAIFDNVSVPTDLTNDQLALLAGMTIAVEAHAIQAEGFTATGTEGQSEYKTAEENAWIAFDQQNS